MATYDNKSMSSATTLSVAVNLVSSIVAKVVGNDVSTSINGEKVNDGMIEVIATNRIVNNLSNKK